MNSLFEEKLYLRAKYLKACLEDKASQRTFLKGYLAACSEVVHLSWKKLLGIGSVVILIVVVVLLVGPWHNRVNIRNLDGKTMEVSVSAPSRTTPLLVKGSIPYWDQKNGFFSFKTSVELFDFINLFWYYMGKDGSVVSYQYASEDSTIINFAHEHNVKVFAVVTNLPEYEGAKWDSERVEYMLADATRRAKHISHIIDKIEALNFDGVTIDYESVDFSDEQYFTTFIQELSQDLHKKGKLVAVALHPKTSDAQGGEELGLFQDWKEIAKYADQLTIMAYGEHWDESSAGPIASIKWVERIIRYARRLNIPPQKLFLGIPLYGYDWNTSSKSKAIGLTHGEVQDILNAFDKAPMWDNSSQSPYFFYRRGSSMHEVWFENAESIGYKITVAKESGLGGISFWRLGGEDFRIWTELSKLGKGS